MSSPKTIPILLLGIGGVGRHLLHHIITCRHLHSTLNLSLRIIAVADSRSLFTSPDPTTTSLADSILSDICTAKSSNSKLNNLGDCQVFEGDEVRKRVVDIARLLGGSTGLVVVDCTASEGTVEVLKEVVELGCCVVLANKKPLTCGFEDYRKLVSSRRRIRYESTVGAGLPVIASINRLLESGDPIYRIIGSLSGTLGYVMSEVENGKLFSHVVQAAKQLGYTEPDPRDDLNGMDVARKALILARLLGQQISMDDLKIESLFPNELGPDSMSTEDFFNKGLPSLDEEIIDGVKMASTKGSVLRYVCTIEGSRCQVGLQELPKDSALGRLRGSDNVVEVYSRCYKESPLVIQGAGAGNDTTAAGVLADIVNLQDLFT